MKAVVVPRPLPASEKDCFVDADLPDPQPGPHDLIVAVEAVSVNPVDCKQRMVKARVEGTPRVLGYDAAGTVRAIGSAVSLFKPGDRVYYAGDVGRSGSNAQLHAVDERIVGRMPATLDFAAAAALPLTAITAWEGLFDRLKVSAPPDVRQRKSILVVGGAGGVGSMVIQLAAKVAGLEVIATATRPESSQWCRDLGADHVVSHAGDLAAAVRATGRRFVDYVFLTNDADRHFAAAAQVLAPLGGIVSIIRTNAPLDVSALMGKSCSVSWEFMFTRPSNATPDMIEQHHLLNQVAQLVDRGVIRATQTTVLTPINAANLRTAHMQVEAGRSIGKAVLHGWG
ncbi:MAG: zinc-binding alcohol dehydrogenase family protein [Burkholderiales bacterium]